MRALDTSVVRAATGALLAAATLASFGCGPAGLVGGVRAIADDPGSNVTVLVFVNNNGEPIEIDVTGVQPNGSALSVRQIEVRPAGTTRVEIPRAAGLRLRACESLSATASRAPVIWDFDVGRPGAATTATFGVESVIVGARKQTADAAERVQLHRLDGDSSRSNFAFQELQSTELAFAPDRVVLHPSGGYAYTFQDLGGNVAEVRAFRVDARTRALQLIEGEFGAPAPMNPLRMVYSDTIDSLDLVIDPLSRFAYLLDNDAPSFRTIVHVFRIQADGSLLPSEAFVRGLLTSLTFRPDGRFVYLYEDFGGGKNFIRAYRIDADTGAFGLLTGSANASCVNVGAPVIAVHPSASYAYIPTEDAGDVKIGAYFIGHGGDIVLLATRCANQFERILDLAFDPSGRFVYATGVRQPGAGGGEAIVRFPIDTRTGLLDAPDLSQTPGDLSNITAGANPALPSSDPFKNIVYVAIGDRLVPHSRDPISGALTPVPGGAALDFGGETSTRFVSETASGTVQVQSQ